jgi:hypothetical protein
VENSADAVTTPRKGREEVAAKEEDSDVIALEAEVAQEALIAEEAVKA